MNKSQKRNLWLTVAAVAVSLGVGIIGAAAWLDGEQFNNRVGVVITVIGAMAWLVAMFRKMNDVDSAVITLASVVALAFGLGILGAAEWLNDQAFEVSVAWIAIGVGVVAGFAGLIVTDQPQVRATPSPSR